MWKCASRTIRVTLKKSVLRCNTVLCTKAQNSGHNSLSKNSPALLEYFNRCYGYYKSNCKKFCQTEDSKDEPKKTFFLNFSKNICQALKLGGVVFLGSYFFTKRNSIYNYYENPEYSTILGCEQRIKLIFNSLGVQSQHNILPEVKVAESKRFDKKGSKEPEPQDFKSEQENFSSLGKAHQKVLGTLNNWLGVQYMESGKHKRAFECFKQAAEEGNTAAIFNLGICHEKGLGTCQDYNEAAEFYQKAAHLGHATAMYNLGIFYVQGLGNIEVDIDHARELFEAAAKLGSTDAEKALNIENKTLNNLPEKNQDSEDLTQKNEGLLDKFICDNLTPCQL